MAVLVGGYLLGLSVEDIRTKQLPVWILGIGCVISTGYGILFAGPGKTLAGALPGAVLILVAVLLPESIGSGDGILAVMYGMIYGWKKTCAWLLGGCLLAAVFGLFWSIWKAGKKKILPFVPFLMLAHVGMCL